jgi:SAM-dependent methyltransferase
MFNNWINGDELLYLFRRVENDETFRRKLFFKLHLTRDARVKASWAHTETAPSGWWEIPAIQRRWNLMISGDAAITHLEYVAQKFLRDVRGLRGLSLGCGTGGKETQWARTGKFGHIDAFDLSPQRIRAARDAIRNTPEELLITYDTADVAGYTWLPQSYDVVLFENSLHHFSSLETLLQSVARALKPNGILVVNEFVGPSRFQWTDNQLTAVNSLLSQFPREYRTYYGTSFAKDAEIRPSRLRMLVSDPSEAIESSKILPVLESTFAIAEIKGYGGALLHLLFSGIAHHFVHPDEIAERLLREAMSREDEMLARGQIDHDFALVVCRVKQQGTPG